MADNTGVSIETEGDRLTVRPRGDWTVRTIQSVLGEISHAADQAGDREYLIDVSELGRMDTAGALVLGRAAGGEDALRVVGEHPYAERMIRAALRHHGEERGDRDSGAGIVELCARAGEALIKALKEGYDTLAFFGRTLVTAAYLVRHPEQIRWTSTVHIMEQAGINALPIVATLSFFIGAVVAFIGANQLALFGATVFTVELVSISVLREFGVIITAVLLAGRSDSAFTAQIGAMKMRQEVDAMRVLGLDPYVVLVIPRLIAVMIMMPLLTFAAMLTGIFGGMLVAWWDLGFTPGFFINRMYETTTISHFWAGIAKAPVFAIIIAVVGCRQGLNVGGNVESLGNRTTASVVQSIFTVIVVDAIFALIYLELGI